MTIVRSFIELIGLLLKNSVCELMKVKYVSDDFSDNNPFGILDLVNHSELPMRQIKIRDPPTQNHLPVLCTLPALYR